MTGSLLTVRTDGRLDGHTNMALDAGLLDLAEAGQPGCHVYQWDGAWVSLGRRQNAEFDLLPDCPAPWVMRPTGGKAVLHGHDMTVGLGLPLRMICDAEGKDISRSIRTVYRFLAKPLIAALNDCGLETALAEEASNLRGSAAGCSSDCFAQVSPNDIIDLRTGGKVCGCALRLTSSAVLLQASIPHGPPLIDPGLVFAAPSFLYARPWNSSSFGEALGRRLNLLPL